MNIFERLASPLAHGVDFGAIARSTLKSGQPSDVEWLLVGLPEYQEHLLRARYQLDAQARRAAWGRLLRLVLDKGWTENAPQGLVSRLTRHAFKHWTGWTTNEVGKKIISPHICKSCEGVGGVMWESKALVCKACDGSGRVEVGPHTIMRVLEIKGRVQHVWVDRHAEILAHMDEQESLALQHMVARLRG